MPWLYTPPPEEFVAPPVIVKPESDALTSGSIWNTRLALFPLIDSKLAPGPSIVTGRAVLLSSSSPSESVIVAAAFPRRKSIVLGLMATLACWTAQRKVPVVPSSCRARHVKGGEHPAIFEREHQRPRAADGRAFHSGQAPRCSSDGGLPS